MTSASLQTARVVASPSDPTVGISTVLAPFRVVVGFVLASLLWKSYAYPAIFSVYTRCQLADPFFPPLFRNPYALTALVLLPMVAAIMAMFTEQKLALRAQAIVMFICMIGLCVHQGSYNDATFVTCLWVSLWCVWFTLRIDDPPAQLICNGKLFAMLIISMIFLGGAMGKMTPEYWSGEVFYEIYFIDRDFWLFNLLRSKLDTETLREVATYYSRMVVMTESACALLWLLPFKLAATLTMMVLLGLTLFSNVNLFSVTFCLLGLCLFVLHDSKR